MPKRTLDPKQLHDEDIMSLSIEARYIWAFLPCFADREGRLEDKPMTIKVEILPNDNVNIDEFLQELANKNHIIRYEINGKKCIQIRSFNKYQKPYPKEAESKILAPPGYIPPVRLEYGKVIEKNEMPTVAKEFTEEELKELQNQYPPFDENAFKIALEIWGNAGKWADVAPEPVEKARKAFNIEIGKHNWYEFVQGLDWAVAGHLKRKEERKWFGRFYTFIENHKWKDQIPPSNYIKKDLPQVNWSME